VEYDKHPLEWRRRAPEEFFLGRHLTDIAFSGCNDAYCEGVEFATLPARSRQDRRLFLRVRGHIALLDLLTRLRVLRSSILRISILRTILFRSAPAPQLLDQLRGAGWSTRELPRNPHRD